MDFCIRVTSQYDILREKMEKLKLKRKYSEGMIPYQDSTLLRYIHVNM